jgi:hypothetical protein
MRCKDVFLAVGTGVVSMVLAAGACAKAGDKQISGPITSIEDLQDDGKFLFKLADTNNDNRISQKEAIDAGNLLAGGFFFRADANGDGTVTAAEAREALFNQKPLLRFIIQRGEWAANQEAGSNVVNQGKMNLMHVLDSNKDGQISADEMRSGMQILVRELRSMQVPEPSNSLSYQLNQLNNTQSTGGTSALAPRPANPPVQVIPGVAPTRVVPPQR